MQLSQTLLAMGFVPVANYGFADPYALYDCQRGEFYRFMNDGTCYTIAVDETGRRWAIDCYACLRPYGFWIAGQNGAWWHIFDGFRKVFTRPFWKSLQYDQGGMIYFFLVIAVCFVVDLFRWLFVPKLVRVERDSDLPM